MKLTRIKRAHVLWRANTERRKRAGFWETLFLNAVLFVIADLLRPKPKLEQAKPAGLGEFNFPTATEGRVVPLIWGTVRIDGPNVVWYGDLIQSAILEKVKTGMFSSSIVTRGYRYSLGVQSALCMGSSASAAEQVTLRRVRIGEKEAADFTGAPITNDSVFEINKPNLFGGEEFGSGGVVGTMRFFAGTKTQAPSSYLGGRGASEGTTVFTAGSGYSVDDVLTEDGDGTATERATFLVTSVDGGNGVTGISLLTGGRYTEESTSPAATTVAPPGATGCTLTMAWGDGLQDEGGVTPAYRDICYIVPDTNPTLLGTSTSIKAWGYEVRRIPDGLALTAGHELVVQGANPANVLYEILTDADWGYGIPAADIDTAVFAAAGDTLFDEGNGFSFILDSSIDLQDLVSQVEQQIEGVVFLDPITAKWRIKLIRDDYDIETVPALTATNMVDLRTFTRSTWESTTNQVRVPFNDQDDDYKSTFGFAQDMANVLIVGKPISTSISHPGVKNGTLANSIAWRELRVLSTPLAQGTFISDRTLYGLLPGDPFSFTDADIGFIKLPMRVKTIDYGNLLAGEITIEAVQDVFKSAAGVFGDPPGSKWEPPGVDLVAYPVAEQLAFEAPRALTSRDPLTTDPETDLVYAAARRQANEVTFEMRERHAAGSPTGAYSAFGEVFQFLLIGELSSSLNLSGTNPVSTVLVVPDPDTQSAIDSAFPTVLNSVELGTELLSLCLIDEEFILVTSSQTAASDVQLNSVYRGVLDSVQADHAAGAKVYMIFVGGGMASSTLPAGDNVEVKLIPRSAAGELPEGDATLIAFTMDDRTRRPYPPAEFQLNNVVLDTTLVDLDGSGSGEDVGVLVDDVIRRDYRTVDEIQALGTDAAALFSDFPTENSTEIEVEVRDGATVLDSETGISGTGTTMRQLDILAGLDTTTLPASLTFAVRQSHTLNAVVYKSRVWLEVVATISSPLIGKHAWGELDDAEESTSDFTVVADTVDHVFALSTAFTAGDIEYELNGSASWVPLITAGGTGGTILASALTNTDTIAIRHNSSDTTPQKLLTMTVSGTEEAYAVLIS